MDFRAWKEEIYMWTEQDDYDEETDMLIFGMMDEHERSSSTGGSGGGCLVFMIGLIGISVLPIIGATMFFLS